MKTARLFKNGEPVLVDAEEVLAGKYLPNEGFVDPEYEFRVIFVKDSKGHCGPYFRFYLSIEDYNALTPDKKSKYDILSKQRHFIESKWHREWEEKFSSFCKKEYYVRGENKTFKRADCYFEKGKTAIEFQHSFIVFDFEERCNFYSSLGLNIVWLYDLTMTNAVLKEDGVFEILENNSNGFFRIAESPSNLFDYPVFIQTKDRQIMRISKLDRKQIDGDKKSTIRFFVPDAILSEDEFIRGIKNSDPLFFSKHFAASQAPKKRDVYSLWNSKYQRMVIESKEFNMQIIIYADGEKMNESRQFGLITYRYVTWDEKRGTYETNSDKFYSLSKEKAKSTSWVLLKAYLKNNA